MPCYKDTRVAKSGKEGPFFTKTARTSSAGPQSHRFYCRCLCLKATGHFPDTQGHASSWDPDFDDSNLRRQEDSRQSSFTCGPLFTVVPEDEETAFVSVTSPNHGPPQRHPGCQYERLQCVLLTTGVLRRGREARPHLADVAGGRCPFQQVLRGSNSTTS